MDLNSLLAKFRSGSAEPGQTGFRRDPRKAHKFFEHAEAVADTRNYDYAIACFISGLRHDPDNVNRHEALRQVALRRKVAGGKPASLIDRFKPGGPTPADRMLHVETLWSKDPLNVRLMRDFMRRCVEADEAESELNIGEVAYWVGELIIEFSAQAKPDKKGLIATRDLFARIGAYGKAVEVCKRAVRLAPSDAKLLKELKDLEAERTMQEGGYSNVNQVEEGGFRDYVRDSDKQEALDQEDRIVKRQSDVDQIIERKRAEYDEDPQDLDRLSKLVDALLNKDEDESENEAIELLKRAQDQSGQYRYKMRIGDIRMKQYNRHLRKLRENLPKNEEPAGELKHRVDELLKKKLAFELEEFQERVKNYPTDLGLRFELGKRLHQAGQLDEAIGAFQQAKADPKHRAAAHHFLGICYTAKGWHEEAVDTLRAGIEAHNDDTDRLALDLRYALMDSLEHQARETGDAEMAREAQKMGSQILQTKIDYRDIQQRVENIRELVSELQAKAG